VVAGAICEIDSSFLIMYRGIIPRLITVARDRIGNMRKNAAIFTAKLSKNAENIEVIRNLHGIEVLHSIFG